MSSEPWKIAKLSFWGAILVAIIGGTFQVVTASLNSTDPSAAKSPVTPNAVPSAQSSSALPSTAWSPTPAGGSDASAQPAQPTTMFLADMEGIDDSYALKQSQRIGGRDYLHSVAFQDIGHCTAGLMPRSAEYQLDGKWRTLHAWVGLSDSSRTGVQLQLDIYSSDTGASLGSYLVKLGPAKEITVSVAGVSRLKIKESYIGGADDYCDPAVAVWGDAELAQ